MTKFKANKSLNIIVLIIVLLIAGIVFYFAKPKSQQKISAPEKVTIDTTIASSPDQNNNIDDDNDDNSEKTKDISEITTNTNLDDNNINNDSQNAIEVISTSANRPPTRSEFRISLGGFGNAKSAIDYTESVKEIGYLVHIIPYGNDVLAQVGPFASEEDANRALKSIQKVYAGANLFYPKREPVNTNTENTSNTSNTYSNNTNNTNSIDQSPAPSIKNTRNQNTNITNQDKNNRIESKEEEEEVKVTEQEEDIDDNEQTEKIVTEKDENKQNTEANKDNLYNSTNNTNAAETKKENAPEKAKAKPEEQSPVYLQLGAFDDTDKAASFVETLQSQGYNPSINAPEGAKTKVLIGPFSGDDLTRAESDLNNQGYSHFRVR